MIPAWRRRAARAAAAAAAAASSSSLLRGSASTRTSRPHGAVVCSSGQPAPSADAAASRGWSGGRVRHRRRPIAALRSPTRALAASVLGLTPAAAEDREARAMAGRVLSRWLIQRSSPSLRRPRSSPSRAGSPAPAFCRNRVQSASPQLRLSRAQVAARRLRMGLPAIDTPSPSPAAQRRLLVCRAVRSSSPRRSRSRVRRAPSPPQLALNTSRASCHSPGYRCPSPSSASGRTTATGSGLASTASSSGTREERPEASAALPLLLRAMVEMMMHGQR
mmetsp:Transcript_76839/g.216000  ORF Transcript_76839/g.216000 Transcript_76839/m.216000 type:complete len:277 (+) Transcript_76839:156-986(+)